MHAAEFLAWDAGQTIRHEFIDGGLLARAEVDDRHITVAGNVAMALRRHLTGTPCRTFTSDMKLHVAAANSYFYPDVMVTCSAADQGSALVKDEPKLLVEVLSPSTAAYDRGDKFSRYRQLPSLQELALIDIDTRRSDVYRKGADGLWVLHPFEADEGLALASVDLSINAATLFAEVAPPAA